jgi:hypothetical protein
VRGHRHPLAGITPLGTGTADEPAEISNTRLMEMTHELTRSVERMARNIQDKSRRVDEKRVQTLAADSETQVILTPQFERLGEIIEAIIVGGSPAATCTVKLGERVWNLTIPATGILVIAPVGITLDYEDDRFLISTTAGEWFLELTGYADVRNRV